MRAAACGCRRRRSTRTPPCQQPAHSSSPKRSAWCRRLLAARPGRLLAAGEVLARHPPARHFLGLRRVADVVDHQDVADVAFHLGRDVGVVLVHVEAVHAAAVGAVMRDQLRLAAVGDVVELEAAFSIGIFSEKHRPRPCARAAPCSARRSRSSGRRRRAPCGCASRRRRDAAAKAGAACADRTRRGSRCRGAPCW